ncbi:MAG: amidohydrolase, partial [Anaerolineae bacterium]|nr:amidohydrolase [Anaerolineae bacterium]
GRGWTQDLWGGQFPTAADLDAVAPENPAFFQAKSGHAAWVNSAALRAAGITTSTPDPDGGEILRDASGAPTGILLENAIDLVQRNVPDPDPETLADYIEYAQTAMLASGITAVHDFDNPSLLRAVQILRERGHLGMRIVKQINKAWLEPALESGIRSGFGDDWIRFGSLKLFADGALGPRTALMVDPYEGQPHNTGIAVVEPEEMLTLVSKASAAGLASTVHAIGDLAVRRVLDVFEQVRREEAERGVARDARRHRIEHVQIIHPMDAHRLAELEIIASMQPIHATSDWEVATRYWGEERCEYAYNARLQIDQGVRVAFGSDAPVEPFDPFKGIHAAVTRQRDGQPEGGWYPELRLTLDEALHGFTTGAAYAAGTEDRQGQIAEGYLADLLVLDRNPYEIPAGELADVGVVSTMVDGIWRSGEHS